MKLHFEASPVPGVVWEKWAKSHPSRRRVDTTTSVDAAANARLFLCKGNIQNLPVGAIVNAAKESLEGGSGVDGAVHKAAGPKLLQACQLLGGCKTGHAKSTGGFQLPAQFIIHGVGPVYKHTSPAKADELLSSVYVECLREAVRLGVCSVAFPCISTGIFGFPPQRAAGIVSSTIRRFLTGEGKNTKVSPLLALAISYVTFIPLAQMFLTDPTDVA